MDDQIRKLSHIWQEKPSPLWQHPLGEIFQQSSITPFILKGDLALRVIRVLHLIGCSHSSDTSLIDGLLPQVCPHFNLTFNDLFLDQSLEQIISCHLKHTREAKPLCNKCNKRVACSRCKTWIFLNVKSIEREEMSDIRVYFEVWKWLGKCETPLDPVWRTHCTELETGDKKLEYASNPFSPLQALTALALTALAALLDKIGPSLTMDLAHC